MKTQVLFKKNILNSLILVGLSSSTLMEANAATFCLGNDNHGNTHCSRSFDQHNGLEALNALNNQEHNVLLLTSDAEIKRGTANYVMKNLEIKSAGDQKFTLTTDQSISLNGDVKMKNIKLDLNHAGSIQDAFTQIGQGHKEGTAFIFQNNNSLELDGVEMGMDNSDQTKRIIVIGQDTALNQAQANNGKLVIKNAQKTKLTSIFTGNLNGSKNTESIIEIPDHLPLTEKVMYGSSNKTTTKITKTDGNIKQLTDKLSTPSESTENILVLTGFNNPNETVMLPDNIQNIIVENSANLTLSGGGKNIKTLKVKDSDVAIMGTLTAENIALNNKHSKIIVVNEATLNATNITSEGGTLVVMDEEDPARIEGIQKVEGPLTVEAKDKTNLGVLADYVKNDQPATDNKEEKEEESAKNNGPANTESLENPPLNTTNNDVKKEENKIQAEQNHNVVIGQHSAFAVISGGQSFINQALTNSVNTSGLITAFGSSATQEKYKTGSHITTKVWNANLAVGYSMPVANGKLAYLGFFEYGKGNYDVESREIKGNGDIDYKGIALATKYLHQTGLYSEFALRYGRAKNNAENVLTDNDGNAYSYKTNSDYLGASFALGKIINLTQQADLDIYTRYVYTHLDKSHFYAGTDYHLDAVNSHIATIGFRMNHKIQDWTVFYGLAAEHEFDGTAKGTAANKAIRATDIKGTTAMAEIGTSLKFSEQSHWALDFGLTGYAGKHQGIRGNFGLSYKF